MSGETMDREERLRRSLEESGVFLVEELGERLARVAGARGLDGAAREEVVQEAFASIFRQRSSVLHPEAWLVRVVDRRCHDHFRRQESQEQALAIFAERAVASSGVSPSDVLDLARAVAELPEKLRRVVHLRYVEGLGSREAAARLGYSPASYRTTLHRTLAALRERLGLVADEVTQPVAGG